MGPTGPQGIHGPQGVQGLPGTFVINFISKTFINQIAVVHM